MQVRFAAAAGLMAIASAVSGCGWHQISSQTPRHFLSQNPSRNTVVLHLYAAENGNNNDMNFDGYGNGSMKVTIPVGWNVKVDFVNTDNSQAHSAMIVPFKDHSLPLITTAMLAFPKASTPFPNQGTTQGVHQSFRFAASKAGHYAIVCGIATHAEMGMWDRLVVSPTASRASIQLPTYTGS